MSTNREKMDQARELIKTKHYDEARSILRTVDTDTARDWSDRLDKIDPPAVEEPPQRTSLAPLIFLAIVILLIAGLMFYQSIMRPMSDHIQQTVDSIDAQYNVQSTIAHSQ